MTKELKELFDGLNHLCETNEAFYFSEQDYNERYIIRSFTYRLASWSDFQLPFAKDCRGTAFLFDKETNEWSLFCRAYRKFFNLGESIPKEITIKERIAEYAFEKLDGSLILVGEVDGKLVAKSKTSINSDHAIEANKLIEQNEKLQNFIKSSLYEEFTPVFELVGPGNFKIVLNYEKPELVFLGYVCMNTSEVVNFTGYGVENFKERCGVRPAEINEFSWDELLKIQETSDAKIEGFVVRMDNGEFVKCKVNAYVNLHHLKDNVRNNANLVPIIINDNLDDLIGAFQDDKETVDYIIDIQEKVSHLFNHLVVEYKELRRKYFQDFNEDRKEFALKFKNCELFGYVMKDLNVSFRDIEQVAEKRIKEYILNKCRTKTSADNFINTLK